MTKNGTLRDQVWHAVLEQLRETGSFKISELPFGETQRHTVRRVLRQMEEMDWLQRVNDRAATWFAGDTAFLLLNLHPDLVRSVKDDLQDHRDRHGE